MYVTNITEYDKLTDEYNDTLSLNNVSTVNENNIDVIIPSILLTILCGLSFLCLMSLLVFTLVKLLFNNKSMENFLYPNHPIRCIITGPTECGKSVLITNSILIIINEFDEICNYSLGLHQDLYQKLIKCFNNYIPTHVIPKILSEQDIDIVNEEIVNNGDF